MIQLYLENKYDLKITLTVFKNITKVENLVGIPVLRLLEIRLINSQWSIYREVEIFYTTVNKIDNVTFQKVKSKRNSCLTC